MVYRSKIGPGILILLIVLIGGLSVFYIIDHLWVALTINLLVAAFIAYMFATTYYLISDKQLVVRSGFLVNISIDIASISAIAETNSILSAPALSLDRIEVFYNKYDSVVISPPNKTAFIAALKNVNPNIQIRPK